MDRRRWWMAAVVLVAVAIPAGCGSDESDAKAAAPKVSLPTKPMSAADARKVDAAATATFRFLTAGKASPGLYVGVWDPRKGVFTKAYGNAKVGGAAATVRDAFRIGSISKTFTATVVLQLVGQGKVDLAEPVETYLPDLVAQFPPLRGITIRQLLSMHSGLPDYLNVPNGVAAEIVADPQRVWKPTELIAGALKGNVRKPGTPGYSTTDYIVLQLLAEQITGQPLQTLIANRTTRPLDIRRTALPPDTDTAMPRPFSNGYLNKGCKQELTQDGAKGVKTGTDTTTWNASYGQGGGGMTSTLTGLARWGASTAGNTLLPKPLARQRLRTTTVELGVNYGLGIMKLGSWYGHEGEAIGWETLMVHNPETGVTFVAAANACNGTNLPMIGLLGKLYPKSAAG